MTIVHLRPLIPGDAGLFQLIGQCKLTAVVHRDALINDAKLLCAQLPFQRIDCLHGRLCTAIRHHYNIFVPGFALGQHQQCNRTFLLAFGASENTIEYAVNYMNIYAVGTIFVQLTLGMNMFITTQGFAKTGMLSVLIGAVMNIVLDPLFIFASHLGVRGAALATILSQAVSCIWVLSFLCGKKTILHIRKKNLILKPEIILPCVALGLATFRLVRVSSLYVSTLLC